MNDEKEKKQLDNGFRVIVVIWGALLISLGAYLVACLLVGKNLETNIGPDFPIETLKYALYGIAFVELFIVHFLRKYLLRTEMGVIQSEQATPNHPAVARYTVIILVTSALLESIGIYGVVLFLLSKDTLALYQLLAISAIAMVHFRPRKEELLALAAK